jgi:predicted nucleic acid-binding protein
VKIVIHDANVLIDLQTAGLLEAFFGLSLENHSTDLVVNEISQSLAPFIQTGRLRVNALDATELADLALARVTQPKAISIQDCSVLFLARRMGGILLTGDGNLRHCAERAGVEVRGTLWILDQLIEAKLLTKVIAARVLEKMQKDGRRLPADACAERIAAWRPT